jgi:hypothetical protein
MSKSILPTLPAGFNEEIVMPNEVNRHGCGVVAKLRLSKVDFEPIAEKNFNGWFGILNTYTGKCSRRETTVFRILQDGGIGYIAHMAKNAEARVVKCKFLNAYCSEDRKYVYIRITHIEG